jgi:hypothetical protein
MSWDNFGIGTNFRYVDRGPWIADLYAQVQQNYDKFGGSRSNEFETYAYNWTLGTKFGYVGWDKWTVAFTAQVDYQKDDIPEMDYHAWGLDLGVDALWNFTPHWNVVGGLHYGVDMNSTDGFAYYYDNPLFARLGFDYNFTDWTYLGIYAAKDIAHSSNSANNRRPSQWNFGAKFGIDF